MNEKKMSDRTIYAAFRGRPVCFEIAAMMGVAVMEVDDVRVVIIVKSSSSSFFLLILDSKLDRR